MLPSLAMQRTPHQQPKRSELCLLLTVCIQNFVFQGNLVVDPLCLSFLSILFRVQFSGTDADSPSRE